MAFRPDVREHFEWVARVLTAVAGCASLAAFPYRMSPDLLVLMASISQFDIGAYKYIKCKECRNRIGGVHIVSTGAPAVMYGGPVATVVSAPAVRLSTVLICYFAPNFIMWRPFPRVGAVSESDSFRIQSCRPKFSLNV